MSEFFRADAPGSTPVHKAGSAIALASRARVALPPNGDTRRIGRPANPGASPAMHEDWEVLPRDFYRRHPTQVAPELLNKILLRDDGRAARIVEVEAYAGSEDPAAHSFRGQTPRNASMFGAPGHLYVYLSYGMHWCCNAVCGQPGEGVAVLLRAAEPLRGLDAMFLARPVAKRPRELANGPGKLSQALGITRAMDGADLVVPDRGISIVSDGMRPPVNPAAGPRVGITRAADFPWRWHVPGDPHVSVGPRRG